MVTRNNYVFRFDGFAPANGEMRQIIDHLPVFDSKETSTGDCCGYFVESSERILLGPVSLARFAPFVPPSAVAFQRGARGHVARFEAPSGPILRVVFEYPSTELAKEQFKAFRVLPGARARLTGRRIGVVLDAASKKEAEQLLEDIASEEERPISFDPMSDGDSMTIEDTLSSILSASVVMGFLIGIFRHFSRWSSGIPDHTIALHISR